MANLNFGQPLLPTQFRGRAYAVSKVCERLNDPQLLSTSVVGGPRTGKASLLRYLASDEACQHIPQRKAAVRVFFDGGTLGYTGKPPGFWVGALRQIRERVPAEVGDQVASTLTRAESGKLDYYDLEDLFDDLADAAAPAILFIDQFEVLLRNRHFWPPDDFFHIVRSLGQRSKRGLAFVVSTPRPILDLWDPSLAASPFYNIFVPVALGRLEEGEIADFVNAALADAGLPADPQITALITQASDRHPCLVYAITSFCIERLRAGQPVTPETISDSMTDPQGVFVTLIREIRAELTPIEREWLDKLGDSPEQLTDMQREALKRLRDIGLLPPHAAV
jgi:hypothetical protein